MEIWSLLLGSFFEDWQTPTTMLCRLKLLNSEMYRNITKHRGKKKNKPKFLYCCQRMKMLKVLTA